MRAIDAARQLDIGERAVLLQLAQDAQVYGVELDLHYLVRP